MADTIVGFVNEDGSLQNTLVIDEADLGSIDIVQLSNSGVTELAVNTPVSDIQVGLAGDVATAIAGAAAAPCTRAGRPACNAPGRC